MVIHEGKLSAHFVELAADRPPRRCRRVGFLAGQDGEAIAAGPRDNAWNFFVLPQQGDIARQIHMRVSIDQRQEQDDDPR